MYTFFVGFFCFFFIHSALAEVVLVGIYVVVALIGNIVIIASVVVVVDVVAIASAAVLSSFFFVLFLLGSYYIYALHSHLPHFIFVSFSLI